MAIRFKDEATAPIAPVLKKALKAAARKPAAAKEAMREVRRDATTDAAGVSPKRIILTMPEGLTKRLDDEWHRRRLTSRAETIRALLEEALK